MVFADLIFLYVFLPLNLVLYFAGKQQTYRNAVLICFSFVFYAWGEPVWIILLLTSAAFDFMNGQLIEQFRGRWAARLALCGSLLLNLGLLGTFKYSGFLMTTLNDLTGLALPVPHFALPIGISFYSFQTISYVIDVYRGDTKAQKNPANYLLYLSLYFQLVAGPVVRYAHVAAEIDSRRTGLVDFSEGITRFIVGLSKKVLVANIAGQFAADYLDGSLSSLTISGAWFGAIMFMLQIYYDFSGYSDMAIGMGRMFGFHFRENFNYPYTAASATEFWRRWHISLSSFFRDYVYIPLGGNRRHSYLNLLAVWLLTGLWHGASWNFVLWGGYWGLFIMLERLFFGRILARIPRFFGHVYMLLVALFGWVLFYFTDLVRLGEYLRVMVGLTEHPFWDYHVQFTLVNNVFWILLGVLFCTPIYTNVRRWAGERVSAINLGFFMCFQMPVNLALLVVCTAQLVGQSYNPFLYYRF